MDGKTDILTRSDIIDRLKLGDHADPSGALHRLRKQGLHMFRLGGKEYVCTQADLERFINNRRGFAS